MIEMPPPWRVVALVAALVCGVVVVTNVVSEAQQVLGWTVAAAVVALLLAPVIRILDRALPRAVAIVLTFVVVGVLGAGVSFLYNVSVLDQVDQIEESAPGIASDIEERDDRIGEIAREIGLVDKVEELAARIGDGVGSRGDAIRSAAVSAPPYFVSMILTIFLLLFGPRLVHGALDQLAEDRRRWLEPVLSDTARRGQIYVWASLVQAAVVGFTVAGAAALLDVPAIGLVAIFAATAALVPYVGIVVGWLPVLVLGLGTASGVAVGIAALVAIGLQLAEWRWWRPLVDPRSVHVGPAVPVIVATLGFGIYGLGGAIYATILAVFALALLDQLSPGEADLPTPIDEPE